MIIIFPASELFLVEGILDDGDLETYLFFLLVVVALGFFILKDNILQVKGIVMSDRDIIKSSHLIMLSLLSFILFLAFVLNEVSNQLELLAFSEEYRNGFYKGSGKYTFWILNVIPALLSFIMLKQKKLNKAFYFSLGMVVISAFLVGLRIFLYSIVFLSIIRMIYQYKLNKTLVYFALILTFLFGFKVYLNNEVADKSFTEKVIMLLARTNYRTTLESNHLTSNFGASKGILLPMSLLTNVSITDFKTSFVQNIDDAKVRLGLPRLSSYAGVAIPMGVYLYNTSGGAIGVIVLLPFILLIFYCLYKASTCINIFKSSIYLGLFISLLGSLTEDINFLNKVFSLTIIYGFLSFLWSAKRINL